MNRFILLSALIAAACAGQAPVIEEPEPEPSPVEPASPEPEEPGPEESVVTIGEPWISQSGIVVEIKEGGHKHAVGGGTMSMFDIEITKGDDVHAFEYRYDDEDLYWYIEGVAHGHVFTIESLFGFDDTRKVLTDPEDLEKNDRRRVTLIPLAGPAPGKEQIEERGSEMAKAVAEKIGCEGGLSSGSMPTAGTYDLGILSGLGKDPESVCRILVGIHTGTAFVVMGGKRWVEKAD